MKTTNVLKRIFLSFMLLGCLVPATVAKTTLTFSGLVESSTGVTMSSGIVTTPDVLANTLNGYTISYPSSMTLEANGWKLSTKDKAFNISGFTAGDVVTITLAANRLTTGATKTTQLDTYKFVAQAGKESVPLTLTGTTLGLYTKDGAVVIESIEIMSAEEAAEIESVTAPIIKCSNGVVTITPGVSSKDNAVTTYYTTDGSIPSATNGTEGTTLNVTTPVVVKAISLNDNAVSEVVSAICSATTPRAVSIDLTAVNTGDNVKLSTTGIKATNYAYANEYLEQFYGTLAFNNPSEWTLGTGGLKSSAANNIFEIPNLKEGDKVNLTITSGRLQLYGQSTSNHLVDGATPSDGYANIASASAGYSYTITMLSDASLKVCTKDAAVNITSISITEKDEEHHEMPESWNPPAQNRALWACQTPSGKTFVSWRARKTDDENTSYKLYRNGTNYGIYSDKTNVTIEGTGETYSTDYYRLEVLQNGSVDETQTMELVSGSVKPHSWLRIKLADEPVVTNTGVMWNKDGVDDGYTVRYTPNDMSCYDMDGDGQEELILKWDPSNSQDNGYSGYTANVYIDCYKVDWTKLAEGTENDVDAILMWRINLGQNIRAGAHYTMFLCYDFDGDGKGEMIVKTSLGTKDGLGNYVFQSRIDARGLDVTRDYTRQDDSGTAQKSNGHIGVGEEWLTVFNGTTGAEMATIDYYPKFNVVSSWNEPSGSSNKYNKGTRFKACVAFLDGVHPSAVYNRGYYSQSFFTAYNWNGTDLYEVWRHASTTEGEGLYGQGNHSLVVDDFDGDGFDEIGTGPAALDNDGTILWTSMFGHGDAHHLGEFDLNNPGLEIFYVNEEYKESPLSTALFDAKTGGVIQGHTQMDMDTGRGLAADISAAHRGAELFSKGDNDQAGETYLMAYCDGTSEKLGNYSWCTGSLINGYKTTDDTGTDVTNDKTSYPNFRIYWNGGLQDQWMDSRHIDSYNDETNMFERVYTFDSPSHPARSINGTKENPNLQTDLFGDWREEVIFYDYEVTSTIQKTVSSKSINNGKEFTIDWDNRQYYLTVFTTTIPTDYKLPWLRDDHAYDMAIAWQNIGYNQPPHLSYSPAERMAGTENQVTVKISSFGVNTYTNTAAVDFSEADGLTVYAANLNEEETEVTLVEVTSKQIPAGTPVILVGTAGMTYIGTYMEDEPAPISTNMKAAPFIVRVNAGNQYLALSAKNGQPVFAKMVEGSTIKARTGYFEYSIKESGSRAIGIRFDNPTGIRTVEHPSLTNGYYYNLAGQRVVMPSKGIYVYNGKKIIIR